MVHGIGQRLEKSNLVDDVSTFRHITASLAERHLTPHQCGIQRVLFIPCQVQDVILYNWTPFFPSLFHLNYCCHHPHLYLICICMFYSCSHVLAFSGEKV